MNKYRFSRYFSKKIQLFLLSAFWPDFVGNLPEKGGIIYGAKQTGRSAPPSFCLFLCFIFAFSYGTKEKLRKKTNHPFSSDTFHEKSLLTKCEIIEQKQNCTFSPALLS